MVEDAEPAELGAPVRVLRQLDLQVQNVLDRVLGVRRVDGVAALVTAVPDGERRTARQDDLVAGEGERRGKFRRLAGVREDERLEGRRRGVVVVHGRRAHVAPEDEDVAGDRCRAVLPVRGRGEVVVRAAARPHLLRRRRARGQQPGQQAARDPRNRTPLPASCLRHASPPLSNVKPNTASCFGNRTVWTTKDAKPLLSLRSLWQRTTMLRCHISSHSLKCTPFVLPLSTAFFKRFRFQVLGFSVGRDAIHCD